MENQKNPDSTYIGISDNRMKHSLMVARRCLEIAREQGLNERQCRLMFLMGYLHDIGYEFSEQASSHPRIGADLLTDAGLNERSDIVFAIKYHGRIPPQETVAWRILNMADYTVDRWGNVVSAKERLEDIKQRYGPMSRQYLTAVDICKRIGLAEASL